MNLFETSEEIANQVMVAQPNYFAPPTGKHTNHATDDVVRLNDLAMTDRRPTRLTRGKFSMQRLLLEIAIGSAQIAPEH